jgi:dCMP deaminase
MDKKILPRCVPERDEFYLGMAFWAASKSKDPSTQCGAIIVSSQNVPLGWGYNGPPRAIDDSDISWGRPEKYDFIRHAERNAIKYSCGDIEGSTIYVTGHPCKHCMLDIVEAGIKRVVWFRLNTDSASTTNPSPKSIEIANLGGVVINKHKKPLHWMRDRMEFLEFIGVFG